MSRSFRPIATDPLGTPVAQADRRLGRVGAAVPGLAPERESVRVSLSGVMLSNGAAEPILLLDLGRALTRLERAEGAEPVRLVELCAFAGFPITEAAAELGLPRSMAQRHFDAAKGFLQLELSR